MLHALFIISNVEIEEYIEAKRELVENYLYSYLEQHAAEFPETLYDGIIYSLEGGKRIRPVLVMGTAEACGGEAELVLPTAAGIELFHTFSLIHDDLPALDDDDWRRGKPSCHRAFGEAEAILIGDALVPLGFELIAEEQARFAPRERVLAVLRLLARALGPAGMIGGQLLDLEAEHNGVPLEEAYEKKTGELIAAATGAGGILAGCSDEKTEALIKFGRRLGLAYQMVDDLLDMEEEQDEARLIGLDRAWREARRFTAEALQPLEALGERGALLRALAEYLLERKE